MLETKASTLINSIIFSPFTKLPHSDQFQTEPRATRKVVKEWQRRQQPLWDTDQPGPIEGLRACARPRKNPSQTITAHCGPCSASIQGKCVRLLLFLRELCGTFAASIDSFRECLSFQRERNEDHVSRLGNWAVASA